MAEQHFHDLTQSNLHYEPFEFSETGSSQRMGKKTRSHVSTRKGSADSLDLRVKFKTEVTSNRPRCANTTNSTQSVPFLNW